MGVDVHEGDALNQTILEGGKNAVSSAIRQLNQIPKQAVANFQVARYPGVSAIDSHKPTSQY